MTAAVLRTPVRLGPLTLRNQVTAAPMERDHCDLDGAPTDHHVRIASMRAAGPAKTVVPVGDAAGKGGWSALAVRHAAETVDRLIGGAR
ncbi:hypothetical protein [Spongiactinospora sp. 9N601]|uniref:hypothetical protein n=1 Tax=Spongiactinospora sp. 9N601 TaxID=3375149 RepID=UPI0037894F37